MFTQPMLVGLNALFLTPAAVLGLASAGVLVKLFAVLLSSNSHVHHR